jgi:hypothetical protein
MAHYSLSQYQPVHTDIHVRVHVPPGRIRWNELKAEWEHKQGFSSDEEDPAPRPALLSASASRRARYNKEMAAAADELACTEIRARLRGPSDKIRWNELAAQLLEQHEYEVGEEKRERRRKAYAAKRAEEEQKERDLAAANHRLAAYEAYYTEQERRRKAEEVAFKECCVVS